MISKLKDAYDRISAKEFTGPYRVFRYRNWRAELKRRKLREELRKFLAGETAKSLGETYTQYIQSDRWKFFTRRIIAERGRMCERCGCGNRTLTVHHLSYIRLGNELPEDVKVYCWPCHKLMHPEKSSGTST